MMPVHPMTHGRPAYAGFGDAAADLAAVSTVGPDGVRVLTPAAAIALTPFLQQASIIPFTQGGATIQVFAVPPAPAPPAPNAMDWVNAELAKGRSVIVSTNTPGGIPAILAGGAAMTGASAGGQVVLVSTSSKADEIKAAGAATGAALFTPSKLAPPTLKLPAGGAAPIAKAGLAGPIGVAILALAVVGGVWYAFGRKKPAGRRSFAEE